MKFTTTNLSIALLGISLLGPGCATSLSDTPIYFNADSPESKSYEPRASYVPAPKVKPRQIKKPRKFGQKIPTSPKRNLSQQTEKSASLDHNSLIIGKPYEVNGRTYVPKHDPEYFSVGMASWSGKTYQNKITASGEPFDRYSLTGAHPTLPLNALVEVTNLSNGELLIIRINDRGPFNPDRILNVTERAAQRLGFHGSGLAKVRVRYVGAAPTPNPATNLKADGC